MDEHPTSPNSTERISGKLTEYNMYDKDDPIDPMGHFIKRQIATQKKLKKGEENKAALVKAENENKEKGKKKTTPPKQRYTDRIFFVRQLIWLFRDPKPYIPQAFGAPFAMLVALHRASQETPARHSLLEEELKDLAQYHTLTGKWKCTSLRILNSGISVLITRTFC